ncbi:MAG TPA: BadF/BadG/BcrA/BcrD ATPase family protein [Vicinamibacteria bacterium]|nr:BadF/BadG/BcrA/BcrD ATPase family protein [Vicinamibacteria bacterium]
MRYVIGIDAGGTKTIGLLADETGQVLSEVRGTGANLQTHGELEVEKVFDDVMEELRQGRTISAVGLGIAGVDRPHDEAVIRGILRRLGHRETARVVNDAAIALVAGAPDGVGIVVLAGTGSIAYGADRAGHTARSGGYGFLLADEGSGYWLGHQALRSVVRAADGRGPATRIMPILFESMEVSSVGDLVPRVYEKGLPKHRIAALAAVVQRAFDEGDEVARALIDGGARELALAARAVARQLDLGDGPFPVVLAGGAFKACPSLVDPLVRYLDLPGGRPSLLQVEPARGAVQLALNLLQA